MAERKAAAAAVAPDIAAQCFVAEALGSTVGTLILLPLDLVC
jgi:hypothetical protein